MKLDVNVYVHPAGRDDMHEVKTMLAHLVQMGEDTMSAISDFVAKQSEHNDKLDAALAGIGADIKALSDKITELQNSAGQVTPEDQALLDQLEARSAALADKFAALDAMNPPPAPPTT